MFTQENTDFEDEESESLDFNEAESSLYGAIYPEEIPIIEYEDEEKIQFSEGLFHLEDL